MMSDKYKNLLTLAIFFSLVFILTVSRPPITVDADGQSMPLGEVLRPDGTLDLPDGFMGADSGQNDHPFRFMAIR